MQNGVDESLALRLDCDAPAEGGEPGPWKLIRIVERLGAALMLLICAPGLLLASAAIIWLSRRSPVVAHRRIGQGGRDIWVLKLRTMWSNPHPQWTIWPFVERIATGIVPDVKQRVDARVSSRFAAFCRKYSIDETPQLWHVLRGEMSLVGPRPLTPAELVKYYGRDRSYLLSVRPGITGLWQVKGRSRLTYPQRRRLDLFMIRHWSVGLYATILKATLPRVLTGKDAW